ncbi:hypothetical protein RJ639_018041 [Escallonia herrerae]|uniref:Uncharacterized protein n=1 Tax=Escallonia herrerae TaxID=1293975 RepID=A0AA89AIZ6_9ASTE|nr:hypothetical protein RJ639_018041 [Escallonia herrerae]
MGKNGGEEEALPLFETRAAKGRAAYKLFSLTVFLGICCIWVYRIKHVPSAGEAGRWAWLGMLIAELCFGFYWIITQSVRWNVTFRHPFKDRLSLRI